MLLVLNSGSSSIKFSFFDNQAHLPKQLSGQVSGIGASEVSSSALPVLVVRDAQNNILIQQTLNDVMNHHAALSLILDKSFSCLNISETNVKTIGHRVVHGGVKYANPIIIDMDAYDYLEALDALAPLHQKHNLHAIELCQKVLPDAVNIACFDTAFHHTHSLLEQKVALPRNFNKAGIRRYGFHGLSYEYIASLLPHMSLDSKKVIAAHLGNGASLCAIKNMKSVASTMGFTALDGLPMGTRCGSIDPGIILYMLREMHLSAENISDILYHQSGLLGVSGISNDVRVLLRSHDVNAQEAIDFFVYQIVKEFGALLCVLQGLDALVFTGGIGEHAKEVRDQISMHLSWLGISLLDELDLEIQTLPYYKISDEQSQVDVWVVKCQEDLMIAKHCYHLLHQ